MTSQEPITELYAHSYKLAANHCDFNSPKIIKRFINTKVYISTHRGDIVLPKEKSLDKVYAGCQRKRKFIELSKNNYIEYVNESRSDLASAQSEFDSNNIKWALVKIYQSLFLLCNAFLVKHEGFYSKDHECILVALIKNKIILPEDADNLASSLRKKDLFEEISAIRVDRNQAMYFPTALRKIDNESMKQDFINTKAIILKLFEEI